MFQKYFYQNIILKNQGHLCCLITEALDAVFIKIVCLERENDILRLLATYLGMVCQIIKPINKTWKQLEEN